MPRQVKPLTNTQIRNAKPQDKDYELSDGNGLKARVRKSGTITWIIKYQKPYTNIRTNISLGTYPEVSLADARRKCEEIRSFLAQGIDPQLHKEQQLQTIQVAKSNTLKSVTLEWLEVKKTQVSQDHTTDILRSLELHVFPHIGRTPISEITAPKTISLLKPIEQRGSPETVKRLCQRLNEIMTFAVNYGKISSNPLAGIRQVFKTPEKNHQPSIPPARLPELMQKLSRANIKFVTRCLIEFQLHTMVRPSEAAGARWSEINFELKRWLIPAERMKSPRDHAVPLSSQVISLLEQMKTISGDLEFIFPADRDITKHTNPSTANMALKRMGFGGELVAHGLRSIASTALNEEGFDPEIVEVALAHVDKNQTRAAYFRGDYFVRRAVMMQWWSDFISKASLGSLSIS